MAHPRHTLLYTHNVCVYRGRHLGEAGIARWPRSHHMAPSIRFTDNGKILNTAGISAGIDGALHVVERLCGKDVARRAAEYMDYYYWKEK